MGTDFAGIEISKFIKKGAGWGAMGSDVSHLVPAELGGMMLDGMTTEDYGSQQSGFEDPTLPVNVFLKKFEALDDKDDFENSL